MQFPNDYEERVYAGVLGKIIGVYLGRPFEGWSYERIMKELGEIWYYVHDRLGSLLVLTDDDVTGTFTFMRALPDYGNTLDLTPAQIGQTWLNYIIEKRTILWWGGLGNSTEHTAFLRLKDGIESPRSGSMELNSKVVAEQIGAQIFIDGWAMVAPGDPELAADLARRAASVSHDGEAIYGAQVLAAMEAQAFVESDIDELIDVGVSFIPGDSVIARMIADIRQWRAQEPDWRKAFGLLAANYGYDKYGGNCHMVPNHGLIILSLLYGDDDFQKTMMIVNTCGWDTDCNSGNAGCLMGIKNGLAGLDDGPDWRGPVADRLYLPAADGADRGHDDVVVFGDQFLDGDGGRHGVAEINRRDKIQILVHVDRPRSRNPDAEGRGDQAGAQDAVNDLLLEKRLLCVLLVDMQRIEIASDTGKRFDVRVQQRLGKAAGHTDRQVFEVIALDRRHDAASSDCQDGDFWSAPRAAIASSRVQAICGAMPRACKASPSFMRRKALVV